MKLFGSGYLLLKDAINDFMKLNTEPNAIITSNYYNVMYELASEINEYVNEKPKFNLNNKIIDYTHRIATYFRECKPNELISKDFSDMLSEYKSELNDFIKKVENKKEEIQITLNKHQISLMRYDTPKLVDDNFEFSDFYVYLMPALSKASLLNNDFNDPNLKNEVVDERLSDLINYLTGSGDKFLKHLFKGKAFEEVINPLYLIQSKIKEQPSLRFYQNLKDELLNITSKIIDMLNRYSIIKSEGKKILDAIKNGDEYILKY